MIPKCARVAMISAAVLVVALVANAQSNIHNVGVFERQ